MESNNGTRTAWVARENHLVFNPLSAIVHYILYLEIWYFFIVLNPRRIPMSASHAPLNNTMPSKRLKKTVKPWHLILIFNIFKNITIHTIIYLPDSHYPKDFPNFSVSQNFYFRFCELLRLWVWLLFHACAVLQSSLEVYHSRIAIHVLLFRGQFLNLCVSYENDGITVNYFPRFQANRVFLNLKLPPVLRTTFPQNFTIRESKNRKNLPRISTYLKIYCF